MEDENNWYALLVEPVYEDDGMSVRVGMAIPDGKDEAEEEVMTSMLYLLYAAFDLVNTDTEMFNKVKEHYDMLSAAGAIEMVEADDKVAVEYLDEDKKIIKLNFSTQTKGRA